MTLSSSASASSNRASDAAIFASMNSYGSAGNSSAALSVAANNTAAAAIISLFIHFIVALALFITVLGRTVDSIGNQRHGEPVSCHLPQSRFATELC